MSESGDGHSLSHLSRTSSSGGISKKLGDVGKLFPLLAGLESAWPQFFVEIGLTIEAVQLFALIINNHYPWSGIIQGIGIPVYFTILPFWDQNYNVSMTFLTTIGFFIATLVILGFMLFQYGLLMYFISEQSERRGQEIAKFLTHFITGILYQPIMHMFLALSVCGDGALTAFSDRTCFTNVAQTVVFGLSIFGMVVLTLLKFMTVVLLYDDHPGSLHWKARPHNIAEVSLLSYTIIAMVLYHAMPPVGQEQAFAGLLAFGAGAVSLTYVFYVPFFHQAINTFRVLSLQLLAYTAMVMSIILQYRDQPTFGSQWTSLVIFGGYVFVLILGYFLARFRICSRCLWSLEMARFGSRSWVEEDAVFPANLPREERTKLREHEAIVLGEARFARTQESLTGPQQEREERRDELLVASPYLDAVYCPQDVEVATRHVTLFNRFTGIKTPAVMVSFGVRIYSKGLTLFLNDLWLQLQFATFLCTQAPQRNHVALAICDSVSRNEPDALLMYRLYRRSQSISQAMFIRDQTNKKSFASAQTLHKEALMNMKLFWTKLLADQVDIVQLGSLAKVITDRREEGLKAYERVVSDSTDTTSLIKYAQFLEQVMMDADAANSTREVVLDSLEQEQLGVTKDSTSKASIVGARHNDDSISRSRTISALNFNINVIFLVALLLCVGLFVFYYVVGDQRLRMIERIDSAGQARRLSQEVLFYVNHIATAKTNNGISAATAGLQASLTSLRTVHESITSGDLQTAFLSVVLVFTAPRAAYLHPRDTVEYGLWEAGDSLISSVETILASTSTNAMRASAIALVQRNTMGSTAYLYNTTVNVYIEQTKSLLVTSQYILIGLFILGLVTFVLVYVLLLINFGKISSSKLSTLSLFTLIPKNALEKLVYEGETRLSKFDLPDEVFESMKIQRGLQDDRDAMKQVMDEDETHSEGSDAKPRVQQVITFQDREDKDPDLDLHGKFATLLKNSTVGDTGKMKVIHHGLFEQPYPKDSWTAPVETADEIKERQRQANDQHVEADLKKIHEIPTLSSAKDAENDVTQSDAVDGNTKAGKAQAGMSWTAIVVLVLSGAVGALAYGEDLQLLNTKQIPFTFHDAYPPLIDYDIAMYNERAAVEQLVFSPSNGNLQSMLSVLALRGVHEAKAALSSGHVRLFATQTIVAMAKY